MSEPNRKSRKSGVNVQANGVKQSIYTQWIKEELEKEQACLELPITIMLLLSFSILATGHLGQDNVSLVERAIVTDIAENANFAWAHHFGHKGIDDVNSFADYWSWVRLGFVPLLAPSTPWPYSEELDKAVEQLPGLPAYNVDALPSRRKFPDHLQPVPVTSDYLRYNRIIGGIRFRQQVAEANDDSCVFPGAYDVFRRWLGKPCTLSSEDATLPPDLSHAEAAFTPQRIEWLLTDYEDPAMLIQRVVDMEDGCTSARSQGRRCLCDWCANQDPQRPWLTELTQRIEVGFTVYNPNYGLYCYTSVNFWFNRAGHIYKLINVRSAWASVFVRPISQIILILCADILWVALCMYVIFLEACEVRGLMRAKKHQKPWYITLADDYFGFWNSIDWISIALAIVIVVYFILLSVATSTVNNALGGFAKIAAAGVNLTRDAYLEDVEDFYDLVDDMNAMEKQFRFFLTIYPLVLMFRLFKSFAAQPRLAIVTETFKEARNDMFHFFIVFFSVYFCMTVNSTIFFGQDSLEFATLDRALHACFRVMFGDWDWGEMEIIGRFKASMWFISFMSIMVLLLLNMLLAILMDAYTAVKTEASESLTLVHQMEKILRRYRQARKKERVRLNDIWDALMAEENYDDEKMLSNDRLIYPDYLVDIVPDMKMEQAIRTLTDSQKDHDKRHGPTFNLENVRAPVEQTMSQFDSIVMCSAFLDSKLEQYAMDEERCKEREIDAQRSRPSVQMSQGMPYVGVTSMEVNRGSIGVNPDNSGPLTVTSVLRAARERTGELSDAMADVLAEEMQSLERRQKEQQKAMEQMHSSLQGVRALAYKLSETCAEVVALSSKMSCGSLEPDAGDAGSSAQIRLTAAAGTTADNPTFDWPLGRSAEI